MTDYLSSATPVAPSNRGCSAVAAVERELIVTGEVEHGNAWGRVLGFPTANIALDASRTGLDGVWAGTATFVDRDIERTFSAAVSIGTRPTYYSDGVLLLEAYLLDFEGDLYGKTLTVSLRHRVRGQVAYTGSEALVEQLVLDVREVRLLMGSATD